MPKPKTKTGPIDTKCSEDRPGVWYFETDQFVWRFDSQARFGINLAMADKDRQPDGSTTRHDWDSYAYGGLIFAKSLDHAVMFAQGYDGGYNYGRRVERLADADDTPQKRSDADAEQRSAEAQESMNRAAARQAE